MKKEIAYSFKDCAWASQKRNGNILFRKSGGEANLKYTFVYVIYFCNYNMIDIDCINVSFILHVVYWH